MHRARLHDRARPGGFDGLGEPGQPIATHDQGVGDAAVTELGQHAGPELRALAGLNPDPEYVFHSVQVDTDRDVGGLVADLVAVADLDHQRVEVDDRIDRVQRPGLPRLDLVEDRVGDLADRLVRQLGADRAREVGLDVTDRHPARVQADDHVSQPADLPFALGHQPGLEGRVPVPRNVQRYRLDLGMHRLRGRPIPGIRQHPTRRVAFPVTQMRGQLGAQPTLENGLDHFRDETAIPGQLQVAVVDPAHQVVQQAGVQHVLDRLPRRRASTLQRPERPRHSLVVRRHRHSLYSLESGTPPTQTI